jgi:hypothetical protein
METIDLDVLAAGMIADDPLFDLDSDNHPRPSGNVRRRALDRRDGDSTLLWFELAVVIWTVVNHNGGGYDPDSQFAKSDRRSFHVRCEG